MFGLIIALALGIILTSIAVFLNIVPPITITSQGILFHDLTLECFLSAFSLSGVIICMIDGISEALIRKENGQTNQNN